MLVDSRRALLVSGGLLAGAAGVGVLVTLPATADAVQAVDDAVWRFTVSGTSSVRGAELGSRRHDRLRRQNR
jgi:hypothetical protein